MGKYQTNCTRLWSLLALLLSILVAGCSADRHPTTGAGAVAPTVTAVAPANKSSGVPINSTIITAAFSEAVVPTGGGAIFTVTCSAPCVNPTGQVAIDATNTIATFTLSPAAGLAPLTVYTATVTGIRSLATGLALVSPYEWHFTTGVAPDTARPTVTLTEPASTSHGPPAAVPINTALIAVFTEDMAPATINAASFTVTCATPCVSPAGTVSYAIGSKTAVFTPAAELVAATTYTATITAAATDLAGNALAGNQAPLPAMSDYVWTFTTGAAPDTTAPTVSSTGPLANASGVAFNTLITVSFSEPMDPLTITTATITLACPAGTVITGTVGYAVNGNVATFTPASDLPASTSCTAQVTTGVKDVAGNAMVSAFAWTFTTGAAPDTTAPTVSSTNPAGGAVGVCINRTINVTFSEPMDPLSITTNTFTLAITAGAPVPGLVTYDAMSSIASFRATADLTGTPATSYTATIKGGASGVKDVAGNALAVDETTTFITNASTCTTAPALGTAAHFGGLGGSATLTNDGLATLINGDIAVNAASTTVTGLRDSGGNVYTITPDNNGLVNGLIYSLTAPPGSVAGQAVMQAYTDASVAFNSISPGNLPGGIDVSNVAQCPSCGGVGGGADELAGRMLPPGLYSSATGTYDIGGAGRTTADLTLDAGGDLNAVWVFQTAAGTGTLNVGLTGPATPAVPIKILLVNGAQSKNVFWYVPAGAVIGTGSTIAGTILSNAAITISTTGGSPPTAVITTINGRAIALTAAVTMTNTLVNVPAP